MANCEEIASKLKAVGVRVKEDYRANYSAAWKFNHWELKVMNCMVLYSNIITESILDM